MPNGTKTRQQLGNRVQKTAEISHQKAQFSATFQNARSVHTVGVTGSNPVVPTIKTSLLWEVFLWADRERTERTAKQKRQTLVVFVCKVLISLISEAFALQTQANLRNQEKNPVVPTIKTSLLREVFLWADRERTERTAKQKPRIFFFRHIYK